MFLSYFFHVPYINYFLDDLKSLLILIHLLPVSNAVKKRAYEKKAVGSKKKVSTRLINVDELLIEMVSVSILFLNLYYIY